MKIYPLPLLLALVLSGCATRQSEPMSAREFLGQYGDVPLLPEPLIQMIEEMNRDRVVKDDSDYGQAFESELTNGSIMMAVLKKIDAGETETARRILRTQMSLNVSFLPVYQKRAEIDHEKLLEAKDFASEYLDYLIGHKNEVDSRYLPIKWALIGLVDLLADNPKQIGRLLDLLKELYPEIAKNAEPDGAANGSQPIRSETHRTPSAAGSRR